MQVRVGARACAPCGPEALAGGDVLARADLPVREVGIERDVPVAERDLDDCAYCRKRYRFEEELRRFVRQAAVEEMPPELKLKLANLRTPLL